MAKARWAYPDTLERKYRRRMRLIVGTLYAQIKPKLFAIFSRKDDIEEQESQKEEVAALILLLLLWWQQYQTEFAPFARGLFGEINRFNDTQFRKMVKSLTGLSLPVSRSLPPQFGLLVSQLHELQDEFGLDADVSRNDRFIPLVESAWLENQSTILEQDVKKYLADLETMANNAIVNVIPLAVFKEQIEKLTGALERRLERFAIDQTNRADDTLNRYRQIGLGATEYIWQTRLDERVRGNPAGKYPRAKPSHWAREGLTFRWSDPPLGGNPGDASGCRCRAIMRISKKTA